MIRRTAMVILYLPQKTNTCSAKETLVITEDNSNENVKLHVRGCNFIRKRLWQKVFFCEFYEIFKNTFFAEHHRVTASDIRVQVVVIYDLNLSLQLVAINLTFFLLRLFTLAHALHNVPVLFRQFAF